MLSTLIPTLVSATREMLNRFMTLPSVFGTHLYASVYLSPLHPHWKVTRTAHEKPDTIFKSTVPAEKTGFQS
jgi:hypothetical protein